MSSEKLEATKIFCFVPPSIFPLAFAVRMVSGDSFTLMYAGSFDAPSSAGITVSTIIASKKSRWVCACSL